MELYERPTSRFVADFLGENNVLSGLVTGRDSGGAILRVDGFPPLHAAEVRAPTGASVTLCLRPEKIQVSDTPPSGVPNVVSGQVERSVYLGSKTLLYTRLAGGGQLLAAVPGVSTAAPEATVALSWSAADAIPLLDDGAPDGAQSPGPAASVAMR
jgi:ABC-type Fe3+/spermidine/putrescine transport system ATPase subunit